MNDTSLPGKNRHPVDRLFDIRAAIKQLQDEETDLKAQISTEMGSADSLGGDECIASQSLQTRKGGIDEDKLKAKFGPFNVDDFRKPDSTFITIKVERRAAEAA